MMQPCVFCKAYEDGSRVLIRTWKWFMMPDLHPVNIGHALVIPKLHHFGLWTLSSEEWADLQLALKLVEDRLMKDLRPDGFNVGINLGAPAGQTVFHLHIHVIPRYFGAVVMRVVSATLKKLGCHIRREVIRLV